jgi:hypothetical protein
MMTPVFMPAADIASNTSIPFISGISMSSVTRSGCNAAMRDIASRPLDAVPTTSTPGIPVNASDTMRRNTTVSSTTRMRVLIASSPQPGASFSVDYSGAATSISAT